VIAEKIGYQIAPSVPQFRRELRVEGPARRRYGPAMARRDHYTEEPHFESCSGALYQLLSRSNGAPQVDVTGLRLIRTNRT
jgi:hypothetical protein